MSSIIERLGELTEAKRQERSVSDVLFIAFCEVYGADFPELRAKYEKWREINVVEAA